MSRPKAPPSSPVAGTTDSNNLQTAEALHLSPDLSRELLQALVRVGEIAARMIGGGTAPQVFSGDNSVTVAEAVNEFLRAKARAQCSDRYLRTLRVSLQSFARGRFSVALTAVTVQEVEKWLQSQEWAPRTQRGYCADVSTLFNFCIRRGLAKFNPAAAVELPKNDEAPVSLHTPEQVRAVLEFARERDLNLCRSLAVRYFCGLRSAEMERISEAEIKAEFVEVTAAKAKTRRRRLVPIQANLKAWLQLGGQLPLHDVNNRMRWFTAALKKARGVEWPHNVTRHSWCSYHLAQFRSAAETALQAGHSEQMLFQHYRELVTPDQAREFWEIKPKA
jgi:site-specific recombinase XerC